ncbi:hypothetical protein N8I74_16600 [Chitiniphilus purpureus]|uniref:Uncharacterized protein n=1 Tax=Chitiniphilus purpureus TaxID=2981137 RepID=A0ABY6DKQ1_9NEIS|nr:hypothetical protein [Chitiniphilus sp. CD1]UXY14919.1 hypothetical protein N8I74_16600 [Chitiniphilus sp. CD1]
MLEKAFPFIGLGVVCIGHVKIARILNVNKQGAAGMQMHEPQAQHAVGSVVNEHHDHDVVQCNGLVLRPCAGD